MKVRCFEGPFDGRIWRYSRPLPASLMLLDGLHYHEYRQHGCNSHHYRWVGCVGRLPIPAELDSPNKQVIDTDGKPVFKQDGYPLMEDELEQWLAAFHTDCEEWQP